MRRFATKLTKVPKHFQTFQRLKSTNKKTHIQLLEEMNYTQEAQQSTLKAILYSINFGIGFSIGHKLFGR